MADHASQLAAPRRLSWANFHKAACQLTQDLSWTGVRKPLYVLSIWFTLNEPYDSPTPQSDKRLQCDRKVAIFHFPQQRWLAYLNRVKAYKRHIRYHRHLLPWTSMPDSSNTDTAARALILSSAVSLPGTPGTQTLVATTRWAAPASPLLWTRQARTCCDLKRSLCCVGRPKTPHFQDLPGESLRPHQKADL